MFKRKAQLTFDDVASAEAKRVRKEINAAAKACLSRAARLAINGLPDRADNLLAEYERLRSLAITIPLCMVEAGL